MATRLIGPFWTILAFITFFTSSFGTWFWIVALVGSVFILILAWSVGYHQLLLGYGVAHGPSLGMWRVWRYDGRTHVHPAISVSFS